MHQQHVIINRFYVSILPCFYVVGVAQKKVYREP
jgi:hypothetical protein